MISLLFSPGPWRPSVRWHLLRQHSQQRADDPRPGGPQGMAQGHRATVDVDTPRCVDALMHFADLTS